MLGDYQNGILAVALLYNHLKHLHTMQRLDGPSWVYGLVALCHDGDVSLLWNFLKKQFCFITT